MAMVLGRNRMHIRDIAKAIAELGLYRKDHGRGDYPSPNQISARASKMPTMFRRVGGGMIELIPSLS